MDDRPGVFILVRKFALILLWREHHQHLTAFKSRECLDLGDFFDINLNALEQVHTKMLVRHFAPAKAQGDLNFVAVVDEFVHVPHLHVVIMRVDVF